MAATVAFAGCSSGAETQAVSTNSESAASAPSPEPSASPGSTAQTEDGAVLNGPYEILLDHVGEYDWRGTVPIQFEGHLNAFGVNFRVTGGADESVITKMSPDFVKADGGHLPSVTFTMNDPKAVGSTVTLVRIQMNRDSKDD
jgi:hypothetical protein